jgi:hypothetical protein
MMVIIRKRAVVYLAVSQERVNWRIVAANVFEYLRVQKPFAVGVLEGHRVFDSQVFVRLQATARL